MDGAKDDLKVQELNSIFKSLGKEGQEAKRKKEQLGNFLRFLLQPFSMILKWCGNRFTFEIYGSTAESLNELGVVGDVDIMIFPKDADLMIHDELIEYLPQHPLHVRIKGADHPVLQSCLVEDTEYVAASALKNFHPAIFGDILAEVFPGSFSVLSSQEKSCSIHQPFNYHVKNKETSPALTINYCQVREKLKAKQAFESEYVHDKSEGDKNRDLWENQNEPKTRQQSLTQECELSCKDLPCNPDGTNENEKRELKKATPEKRQEKKTAKTLFEHVFCTATKTNKDLSKESDKGQLHQLMGGVDYDPAFRSLEWPKVAQEWIKRERKWPSPDMVDRVIQEGFHLVVKSPKNGGNPDCDFRISFSHAEYLLSQEMNEIQRECYRCMKKYHRTYLSPEPKSLVTFHLKNILLETIEETGTEMWTESNRAECMMKLLSNLLKALKKKDLKHFFVRSFNLFCFDYIEDPEILESLAGKVKQIMESPVHFANKLTQIEDPKDDGQAKKFGYLPSSELTAFAFPFTQRSQELKDNFLSVCVELIDMAFNNTDCRLPDVLDPLERSLVEDLREIGRNDIFPVEECLKMFHIGWITASVKVCLSNEPNIRRRMLCAIQDIIETWKYVLRQDDLTPENEDAIIRRMLHPTGEDPFDFNHIIPGGLGMQIAQCLESMPAQLQDLYTDDIPLD